MKKCKIAKKFAVTLVTVIASAALVPGAVFADDTDVAETSDTDVAETSDESAFSSASGFFAGADFTSINNYYNNLCDDFSNMGWGRTSSLEIPKLSDGYASNVQELFNASFGDLYNQVQLDTSDPLGNIDVSSFMSQAAAQRDSIVGSYTSSASYQLVSSSISVGSVFAQAKETKTMPSVLSTGELINLNRDGDTMARASAHSANSSQIEDIQNWGSSIQNNLNTSNPDSKASKMNESVKTTWDTSVDMINYQINSRHDANRTNYLAKAYESGNIRGEERGEIANTAQVPDEQRGDEQEWVDDWQLKEDTGIVKRNPDGSVSGMTGARWTDNGYIKNESGEIVGIWSPIHPDGPEENSLVK